MLVELHEEQQSAAKHENNNYDLSGKTTTNMLQEILPKENIIINQQQKQ